MKKITLCLLLLFACVSYSWAQSEADSLRFCNPDMWRVVSQEPGLKVSEIKSQLKDPSSFLFGSAQHIYIMQVDPTKFRIEPAQQIKKRQVSSLCRDAGAIAGINGGFFVVDKAVKDTAVANDFLKINGRVISPTPSPGWGGAAVAFDNDSHLHYTQWSKAMERDTANGWSAVYGNVMTAGPMLILNGKSLHKWVDVDKNSLNRDQKHATYAPRTTIGTKADGTIVMMVVDGRRTRAFGASISELATLGRWLGLTNMINLDGGGSSTMIYREDTVNFPSDFLGILPIERSVANALLIFAK